MAHYTFREEIGSGSFGVVCRATCDDGWEGAVKRIKEDHSEEDLARFRREVRLQAQLKHPNVVAVRAMNLEADRPWFAMERAVENLRDRLVREGGSEKHLHLFHDLASGVEYAHRNGIIHRDLKPENLLLFDDPIFGVPEGSVADFGLGKHIDQTTATLTSTNIGLGTMAYMAPEQLTNAKDADERCDIYALGKILYEILTGNIPWPVLNFSKVPSRFRYVVQKATDNEPDRRYQTVTALLEDLELLSNKSEQLERPQVVVLGILEKYATPVRRINPTEVALAVRLLVENLDDYTLLINGVPKIPEPLFPYLFEHHEQNMQTIIASYDAQLENGVTFEYCDVVANFYDKLFDATEGLEVRSLILRRMSTLGYENNRWHVGRVFGRILSRTSDPALLMVLRDHLGSHPSAASWLREYVSNVPLVLGPLLGS